MGATVMMAVGMKKTNVTTTTSRRPSGESS